MREWNLYKLYNYALYNAFSDEEMIQMARNGDKFVEECLYCRYFYTIKKIISPFFIIGGDREDLMQEGMLGLYNAIRDYHCDKNCSFKSYASVCIKRRVISAIRSSNRHKHNPLNNYISFSVLISEDNSISILDTLFYSTTFNPEEVILNNEERDRINFAIKYNLSSFEQQVINYYIMGMSYRNISELLDVEEKSVDNALQRIRKKLKNVMVSY